MYCRTKHVPDLDRSPHGLGTFNTPTRDTPVTLLQEYMNFTGKTLCFLRVDNAKEFTCPDMVDFCNDNNIILQVVVSFNHLMQDRVEGVIDICKQHTRVGCVGPFPLASQVQG